MKGLLFLLLTVAIAVPSILNAQQKRDEIILMSGKSMKDITVTTVGDIDVKYQHHKKSKTLERFVDKYRVFSIKRGDGTEEVIYKQDTMIGNYYTEHEMRMFITGETDARELYHARSYTLGGMAICGGGGFIMYNSFIMVGSPFAVTAAAGIPGLKIKQAKVSDPKFLAEPSYIQGYERTAKAKRIQNTLIGSAIGLIGGMVLGNILKPVL